MPKSNEKNQPAMSKSANPLIKLMLYITPNWLTPNAISLLRLALIPLIIAYLLGHYYLPALAIFLLASLLDAYDGALARARGQISDWGLILDPLSDKLLIIALAGFLLLEYPFRELIAYALAFDLFILIVSAVKISRAKAATAKPIVASNIWGKSKMLCQVTGIALALAWLIWPLALLLYLSACIIWLSLALQIRSAVSYS